MAGFYTRSRNLYDPNSQQPFKLSRSKIDLFLSCPRCFYMDRRMGVKLPGQFPFHLNSAVDNLFKNEFDKYRAEGKPHPIMEEFGVNAVPFPHTELDAWRDALKRGITYLHPETNFIVGGGVDDVWVNPEGKLHIVDYKATSKDGEVGIDAPWQITYKRQVEIYQWLFHQNGFEVSPTAYFVYANGIRDRDEFNNTLTFKTIVIPYEGKWDWVSSAVSRAKRCLDSNTLPKASGNCDYCQYRKTVHNSLADFQNTQLAAKSKPVTSEETHALN